MARAMMCAVEWRRTSSASRSFEVKIRNSTGARRAVLERPVEIDDLPVGHGRHGRIGQPLADAGHDLTRANSFRIFLDRTIRQLDLKHRRPHLRYRLVRGSSGLTSSRLIPGLRLPHDRTPCQSHAFAGPSGGIARSYSVSPRDKCKKFTLRTSTISTPVLSRWKIMSTDLCNHASSACEMPMKPGHGGPRGRGEGHPVPLAERRRCSVQELENCRSVCSRVALCIGKERPHGRPRPQGERSHVGKSSTIGGPVRPPRRPRCARPVASLHSPQAAHARAARGPFAALRDDLDRQQPGRHRRRLGGAQATCATASPRLIRPRGTTRSTSPSPARSRSSSALPDLSNTTGLTDIKGPGPGSLTVARNAAVGAELPHLHG